MKLKKNQNPRQEKYSAGIILAQETEVVINQLEICYYLQIADHLKSEGHKVDFLTITPRNLEKRSIRSENDHLVLSQIRDAGHRVICEPYPDKMPNIDDNGQAAEVPFLAYETLKNRKYDVIHFQDYFAPAYYYLLARREGLLQYPASVAVHVYQPLLYRLITGRTAVEDYSIPARCTMERYCIENADGIYVRSEPVHDKLTKLNYLFHESKTFFVPQPGSLTSHSVRKAAKSANGITKIEEILFASPVNQSAGFTTFVYALEVLAGRGISPKRVCILGSQDEGFSCADFLANYRAKWPFAVELLPSASAKTIQMKIESPEVLAVFPAFYSSDIILPNIALAAGRPFLATETADLRRLLPEDLFAEYFVAPHHLAWANRLGEVLRHGIALPSCEIKSDFDSWWINQHKILHKTVQEYRHQTSVFQQHELVRNGTHKDPMVSACIAHFNRPDVIWMLLESLRSQTFRDFEVIIVDDGSSDENYKELKAVLTGYPEVQLVRQENRYLGAVRNTGARHAKGKYLLFLDDDNYAKPEEIETFVRVAEFTDSDILTCFSDLFTGEGLPDQDTILPTTRMPFGSDLYYGLLRNGFGDSNCFVRRSVWKDLGGFTEHYRIGLDDHEFFSRAVISGYKLLVIPESLFFYRLAGNPMRQAHVNRKADFIRVLDPYLENDVIDPEMLPLIFTIRNVFNLR
ncbi:MAG: glycosyltransferase [Desulfobacterales bacterium]|nr:glycosyltransferase [Desulfobacterales bacterium]